MAQLPIFTLYGNADINDAASSAGTSSTPVLHLTQEALTDGYDGICMSLTNDAWRSRWKEMCTLQDNQSLTSSKLGRSKRDLEAAELWRASEGPFRSKEMNVTKLDEAVNAVGIASDWLELDSPDDGLRYDSEIALRQELSYATYLGFHTILLPPPKNRQHAPDYARAVNACLLSTSPMLNVSIRIPIYDPRSTPPSSISRPSTPSSGQTASGVPLTVHARAPDGDLSSTWEIWDVIRTICNYNPRLSLTLDLSLPLPSSYGVLSRWSAEPVSILYLPATSFIANAKGYPVLTKATQTFLRDSMRHKPTILLSGTRNGVHGSKGGEQAYLHYVRHLQKTAQALVQEEKEGTLENFAKGYWDYLQAPLQPLMDNLQSMTYETFERDPVKYERYEEAVFLALQDRPANTRIVICLAGAGRGPLVSRCLNAFERSKRIGIVYALEKNPNAFVTLQERKEDEWGDRVELLYGDMRKIELPEPADILVSELLGSFGDNEASPECLDGAMRFLKPDGVSIPSSYAAYIAPISSSKLHMEALQENKKDGSGLETPFVVMFQAVNIISGEGGGLRATCGTRVQECWSFTHPRPGAVTDSRGMPITNAHNTRSARLTFHIPHAGVLHGLAGYFDAVLYGDVGLSIHPESMERVSPNMLSWFPIFFPFKEPLYLPSNSELQVTIWRVTDRRKIWYEWYAESYLPVMNQPLPSGPVKTLQSEAMSNGKGNSNPGSHLLSPASAGLPSPLVSNTSPVSTLMENSWTGGIRMGADGGSGTRIKIGQTALHNPGGKSSWMGL